MRNWKESHQLSRSVLRIPNSHPSRRLRIEPLEDRLPLAVITVDSVADNFNPDGQITLREAVRAANLDDIADAIEGSQQGDGADTIRFHPDIVGQVIALTEGQLTLSSEVSIVGQGESLTIISGSEISRVFLVDDGTPEQLSVALSHLTVRDGFNDATVVDGGAGIQSYEDLELDSVTIDNNFVDFFGDGAGLSILYANLFANNITVTNNYGPGEYGSNGGVSIFNSNATIRNSHIAGNSSRSGGLYVSTVGDYDVEVIDTDIVNNRSLFGGGLFVVSWFSRFTMTGGSVSGHDGLGPGVYLDASSRAEIRLDGVEVVGNHSEASRVDAGGLYASAGGVGADSGVVRLSNLTVANNVGRSGGLALGTSDSGQIHLDSSTVHDNTAVAGKAGGIYVETEGESHSTDPSVVITNTTVSGNIAPAGAGGVHFQGAAEGPDVKIRHATIVDNQASEGVGGILVHEGQLLLENTIVAKNEGWGAAVDVALEGDGNLDLAYSLIGSNLGTEFVPARFAQEDGNLIGTGDEPFDPRLKPLGMNGGETPTHALHVDSPAIEAGDDSTLASEFDQRGIGFPRRRGTRVDLGATEYKAVLQVDNPIDEADGDLSDGEISLREAIELANVSLGTQLITFDPALTDERLAISLGELPITDSLIIRGPGKDRLRLDAEGQSRIFHVDSDISSQYGVQIRGVELARGNDELGGAIRAESPLSLDHVTIRDSVGINGGAIYSNSMLDLNAVSILNNEALEDGGGVYHDGPELSVENSSVAANVAEGSGGGLIVGSGGNHRIVNTTVSGNLAHSGGGVFVDGGGLIIRHSTITENLADGPSASGGGIATNDSLALDHVIVAGNRSSTGPDIFADGTADVQPTYSLIGDLSDTDLSEANPDGRGNLIGGPVGGPIDPRLLPLENNGGPTLTHRPAPLSPVKDAGTASSDDMPELDQRGRRRFVGTAVDIGAVELQLGRRLVVDTLLDESDGDFGVGDLSLREAIEISNATQGMESIEFDATLWGQVLTLTHGELSIESPIVIDGPAADKLTINGNGQAIFVIDDGDDSVEQQVLIAGLAIVEGNSDEGGAIYSAENLTILGLYFSNNSATGNGGAISSAGSLSIAGTTFGSNAAGGNGGALFANRGTVGITNSTFSANESDGSGGAIFLGPNSRSELRFSTITMNVADRDQSSTGSGGGLAIEGDASLSHVLVASNVDYSGIAPDLFSQASVLTSIENSLIGDNRRLAPGRGESGCRW